MENLVEFWKDKTVLITGHTGFKGGWLSLLLQHFGAKLVGVALDPISPYTIYEQARVGEGMVDIRGDINDFRMLLQIVKQYQPEIVFHLAAQPLVRQSYLDPQQTFMTNVMGSVYLLDAIRKEPSAKAILNITSDKCYKNQEWHWGYRETDALGGYDPYSTSKACSELVTASFRQSFFQNGVGLATARAGNVIGGGDWAEDRLIPDYVRSMLNSTHFSVRNPSSIRPWQHVLDPLFGYLMLAQKLYEEPTRYSEAWNFGPDDNNCITVRHVAECLSRCWGSFDSHEHIPDHRYHEATFLKLDCSKARERLLWDPKLSIESAIQMSVDWYRKCLQQNEDLRSYSLSQIEDYIQLQTATQQEAFT